MGYRDQIVRRRITRLTGLLTTCVETGSMPRDPPVEATCVWSMSLTRFGVVKLRAAVRAMLKQYDGAAIQMATQCRITSLASRSPKTNRDSPRYSCGLSLYARHHRAPLAVIGD